MLEGRLRADVVDAGLGREEDVARLRLQGRIALVERSDEIPVAEQANNAAGAGAALVLVHHDRPGSSLETGPTTEPLAVPTARISHEEGTGAAPGAAVRPGACGRPRRRGAAVLLRADGHRAAGISRDLRHVARTRSLATVTSALHSQVAATASMEQTWYPFQPWQRSSGSQIVPVRDAPRNQVTYLTPSRVRWSRHLTTPERQNGGLFGPYDPVHHLHFSAAPRSYAAGRRYRQSWLEQPVALGVDRAYPPTRVGDVVELSLGFVDSGGHFAGAGSGWFEESVAGEAKVFRGGELVASTTMDATPLTFEAAPSRATYRVVYDAENRSVGTRLSTRTRSEWTFVSRRPAEGKSRVEPMLSVDWDLDLDLRNRAGRGRHRIGLSFSRPGGATKVPVSRAVLSVSYDDGRTWQRVRDLRRARGGDYTASVQHRRSARFVSLRLSATDRRGSTLRQKVIRAYVVR
ncbi:hypothetical protein MF408_05010 [Nocardioides sp. TF02-7]|nr:hypothetical protein MF408_05010 [Nocardioides sp. TF02-7]